MSAMETVSQTGRGEKNHADIDDTNITDWSQGMVEQSIAVSAF